MNGSVKLEDGTSYRFTGLGPFHIGEIVEVETNVQFVIDKIIHRVKHHDVILKVHRVEKPTAAKKSQVRTEGSGDSVSEVRPPRKQRRRHAAKKRLPDDPPISDVQ